MFIIEFGVGKIPLQKTVMNEIEEKFEAIKIRCKMATGRMSAYQWERDIHKTTEAMRTTLGPGSQQRKEAEYDQWARSKDHRSGSRICQCMCGMLKTTVSGKQMEMQGVP